MINAPHLFQFLRIFQYERRTWCKLSANLIFNTICDFFWQLPINMFFIKEKLPKQAFCNFSGYLLCFVFLGQYPQKMCYCDQNHHQQAIYLNVSNFLMIFQPKNDIENLSLFGWYLVPILPGPLLLNIKLINPIQTYPHIIKSYMHVFYKYLYFCSL